jgi:hypothetical protein
MHVPRAQALLPFSKSSSDRPVFVLTYHPYNLIVVKIVKRNFYILLTDPSTRDIFPDQPLDATETSETYSFTAAFWMPKTHPVAHSDVVVLVSLVPIRYRRTVYLSLLDLLISSVTFLVPPATLFIPLSACDANTSILVK